MTSKAQRHQKFRLEKRDGTFFLSGTLNEAADLTPLTKEKDPVRMDIGEVGNCNSMGLLRLLKVIDGWKGRPFSYQRCTRNFVHQITMLPSLLGSRPYSGTVETFEVNWVCDQCVATVTLMQKMADFQLVDNSVQVAPAPCPTCKAPMTLEAGNEDLIQFLSLSSQ